MDTSTNNSINDDDEYILSLAWKQSVLSAAYFNKRTMDVHLVKEVDDFKPGLSYTANLLRQLTPSIILASGSVTFHRELLRLLNYPPNTDLAQFKYSINHTPNSKLVLFSNCDAKHLAKCRQRILSLDIPGMNKNMTDIERSNFMETIVSSHQEQLVMGFGNLLIYLDEMWKHIFLITSDVPTIASVSIRALNDQVLIDEDTLSGLHVFFLQQHPSGFKIGSDGGSKEGFSLYSVMNRCYSKIGGKYLRTLMQQPTNSLDELNSRLDTIDWCLDKNNFDALNLIKSILRKTGNINEDFGKLLKNPTKRRYWLSFARNILNLCSICQLCLELEKQERENVLLSELAVQGREHSVLLCVSSSVCKMINFEQDSNNDDYIIRTGFHRGLDEMRKMKDQVRRTIYEKFMVLVRRNHIAKCTVTHFAEIGYVLGVKFDSPAKQKTFTDNLTTNQLEFLLQSQGIFCYKFAQCNELNESFRELNVRARCQEEQILKEFLSWYTPNVPTIQYNTDLYAKLDCMMVFAEIATKYELVRPELTHEKALEIRQGRHFLFNSKTTVTPNDTIVNGDQFVTLLMAPNAAGKSFYLRQIGLIVYMAHIGCFVPATAAKIGLVGEIFTRLYSEESTHNSQSSFQLELIQMSRILSSSSDRSLILIDEFGKGTNLIDGKAILLSCIEHLLTRDAAVPITFITSHFSEVCDYYRYNRWVQTKTFKMFRHENGSIYSSHELIDGEGAHSYAHQCEEVKVFLDWILKQPNSSGHGNSDFGVDSLTEEVNDVYLRKVEFCTESFSKFMLNGGVCDENTFGHLESLSHTNKANFS
ncbi:mutS protein homolog 5-like [Bradysia coprophila]|uniref:mutS protein homolog 5-like n=1 Tax=Bradysia coprophila TaxID=38358 RepID=UPI00187DB8EB|nr:mutS protein homolog 5-like [Bradysia coprophila]